MTSVIEDWFKQAREHAAQGSLVVVREDGRSLLLPAMRTTSVKPEMAAVIEQIIPSTTKRRVAVIGETSWASNGQPNLQAANQAIPFWGLLMGFASIGHAVCEIRGHDTYSPYLKGAEPTMKIFSNFLHGFCSLFRGNVHNGFMPFKMPQIPEFLHIPQFILDATSPYPEGDLPHPSPTFAATP
jgi:hypothetical protein